VFFFLICCWFGVDLLRLIFKLNKKGKPQILRFAFDAPIKLFGFLLVFPGF
jgi:hypothetical protein